MNISLSGAPLEKGDSLYNVIIANIAINGFLCYVTTMMNIVTIHALRKTPALSKPLRTLLLSLAVSDLGVGLLSQPMYIASLVEELRGKSHEALLDFSGVVSNILFISSFCSITALSADRYLAIQWPLRYQELVTHKRVVILVMTIWLFSVVFMPIEVLVISKNSPRVSSVIFFIIHAVFFAASTCTSFKIYLTVRRHNIHIQSQTQHATQNSGVNMARVSRSAQSTIFIYLLFWLCYLPNFSLFCNSFVTRKPPPRKLETFTVTLVLLNSSLNPIIYCWKIRYIRPTILDILRRMKCKLFGSVLATRER